MTTLQGTHTMNPEIKEKWLTALRSGQYAQGRTYLKNYDDQYCCLGVLGQIQDELTHSGVDGVGYDKRSGSSCFPSNGFLHEIGLDLDLARELAEKNDNGVSFAEIADIIQERA